MARAAHRAAVLADAVLADAVRKGWVTPPSVAGDLPAPRPVVSLAELLKELDADRAER